MVSANVRDKVEIGCPGYPSIHQAGTRSAKYRADDPVYPFIIKITVLHSYHISHIHNVEMACNAMCLSRPVAARKAMAGTSGTSAPQPSVHLWR
jgi:hypothetical protein